MPAIKNNYVQVIFRTTAEIRERLEHHAKRIGIDMNGIVRDGTIKHLEELDEKEATLQEMKRLRASKGAFVPSVAHRWGKPPQGRDKNNTTSTPLKEPPDKIKRSFRRYAEYIEAAEDKIDSEMRSQTVIDDIRQRIAPEDVNVAYDAFKEFLKTRTEARYTPIPSVAIDEKVDVAGDVV